MIQLPCRYGGLWLCNSGRDSYDSSSRWDWPDHNRTSAYFSPSSDSNWPEYNRTGTENDIVFNGRMAFCPLKGCPAKYNSHVYEDVIADLSGFPDYHPGSMINKYPFSKLCSRMDFNPCKHPCLLYTSPSP